MNESDQPEHKGPHEKPREDPGAAHSPERAPDALSHVETAADGSTRSVMVDVGHKKRSARRAEAEASVLFPPGVMGTVLAGDGPKGAIVEVARIAGIMAAKRTGDLIPMCHPLALDVVELTIEPSDAPLGADRLTIRCAASCTGPTGVEMEAMTGASVAALTVYDMTKALSKGISIESVRLISKSGGKSGNWKCSDDRGQ